jgi:hypothetical protein
MPWVPFSSLPSPQNPHNIPIGRNIFPRGIMGSSIIEFGRAMDKWVIEKRIARS